MAEDFQDWAPRLEAALDRLPGKTREVLAERVRRMGRDAKSNAARRRGGLARAIRARFFTSRGAASGHLNFPAKYAPIEFGGTVRPRGRYLAVPIAPAALSLPGPRSDSADLFVLTSRDGRRFLASRQGGAIEIRWRLMRSVRIKGQHFAGKAFDAAAKALPDGLLDRIEAEVLGGK